MLIEMAMAAAAAAAVDRPTLPDWMAGCWEQQTAKAWTEECWTTPKGGVMLGSGRTIVGGRLQDWETMQIMLPDQKTGAGMVFWASPRGGARTAFAWSPGGAEGLTFLNTAHDYPQRIRYWRDGKLLNAEISMADGSRPMRWTYRRR